MCHRFKCKDALQKLPFLKGHSRCNKLPFAEKVTSQPLLESHAPRRKALCWTPWRDVHECSESAQTSKRPSLTSWFDTIFSRLELGAGCVRGASGRAERQYRTAGPVCSHLSACRLHSIAHARPFVPVECNPEEKVLATSLAAHICPKFGADTVQHPAIAAGTRRFPLFAPHEQGEVRRRAEAAAGPSHVPLA